MHRLPRYGARFAYKMADIIELLTMLKRWLKIRNVKADYTTPERLLPENIAKQILE